MAYFSSNKLPNSYHVRATSLPARLHPSAKKLEEDLKKLTSFDTSSSSPSSKTVLNALSQLMDLYKSIVDLFNLPAVQQALGQYQVNNSMNQLLDVSIKYLDICGRTRDAISQIKESICELRSALRRKKGADFSIQTHFNSYVSSRKKIKKEISSSLVLLKETDTAFRACSTQVNCLNQQHRELVQMLREAVLATGLIFRQLLWFLSTPVVKPKPRWGLVLGLMKRAQPGNTNELEEIEMELRKMVLVQKDLRTERMQCVMTRLETVDLIVGDVEASLECLFRQMIQCRVSLLNILSV